MQFKKSQTGVEFVILMGFASLVAMLFIMATISQIDDFNDLKEQILIKDVAYKLRSEIYLASIVKEGYQRDFTLPELLDYTIEYNATIKDNKTLWIRTQKYNYFLSIPEVLGNPNLNNNTITKEGGVIYLN